MVNRSKAKGTSAESAVVDHLKLWFPGCERRTLSGAHDKGDIAGIPDFVGEVKACGTYDFGGWVREARTEAANATATYYAAIIKPRGVGDTRVGEWWALTSLHNYASLLAATDRSAEQAMRRLAAVTL